MEILELKTTLIAPPTYCVGSISRMTVTEDRISEPENWTIEFFQSKQQRENVFEKKMICGARSNTCIIGVPEGNERGAESIWKK